jgi:hypothetical protein
VAQQINKYVWVDSGGGGGMNESMGWVVGLDGI